MKQPYLQLEGEPIGAGQERLCYRHPDDAALLVKVQRGVSNKQTRRELALYHRLARRGMNNFEHIPKFHGEVETNLGSGFVVDCISDFDGSVSKSLWWHFQRGYPLSEFLPYLQELQRYLLANRIVFSVDMGRYNILFQKLTPAQARLVVIDGLGDHTAINWQDNIGYFARRKIRRRWQRFIDRLDNFSEQTMREQDGAPQTLETAYRRQESK
jgi:hypothetical protein